MPGIEASPVSSLCYRASGRRCYRAAAPKVASRYFPDSRPREPTTIVLVDRFVISNGRKTTAAAASSSLLPFRFVSFRFVPFRPVSFRFVSFRFVPFLLSCVACTTQRLFPPRRFDSDSLTSTSFRGSTAPTPNFEPPVLRVASRMNHTRFGLRFDRDENVVSLFFFLTLIFFNFDQGLVKLTR